MEKTIPGLVQNFDFEFDLNGQNGHSDDWLNVHISMLYNELAEIQNALFVFLEVEKEWERRAQERTIHYSSIRTILYEALPYRIIMGLGRIFVGRKEFSLAKTINIISQRSKYKNNKDVISAIKEIQQFLSDNSTVKIIREYRDKFFAHLDDGYAMSNIRIAPSEAMRHIDPEDIEKGIQLTGSLYKSCFHITLTKPHEKPSTEDIIKTFFWM